MTLRECIDCYHAAMATRDPSRPITVHRVVTMSADKWRFTVAKGVEDVTRGERLGIRALAGTGDRLGLPVGRIVETTEREP